MGTLRTGKIVEILQHLKEANNMQKKLLPVKHFENVLFHSLSPYDYQLHLNKSTLVDLFTQMNEHKEDIALMKPVAND